MNLLKLLAESSMNRLCIGKFEEFVTSNLGTQQINFPSQKIFPANYSGLWVDDWEPNT